MESSLMGVNFQATAWQLTLISNCHWVRDLGGVNPTQQNITDCAVDVGLGSYIDISANALSGGNKQKLCLDIALYGDPTFLLLDK
eukprot:9226502-Ditylum_brightwellii.AAC.1